MSTTTLSIESSLQMLINKIQGSRNLYDVVAACYHTLMQFQHNHEPEFIIAINTFLDNPNDRCARILENYRSEIEILLDDMHYTTGTGFQGFINGLIDCIKRLDCPREVESTKFVSFCAFYTIELIDLDIEGYPPNKTLEFPDHGPLNKNVCTNECSVYFHESDSFLSNIYRLGKNGFRKPLHPFRLGSVFHKLLMFECTEFNASIPKIVPVFMTNACKQQIEEECRLRIASIPFIGFDTFDVFEVGKNEPCSDIPDGPFYVKYREDSKRTNTQTIIQLIDLAVEKSANIIVFPEYIMSSEMLMDICSHLGNLYDKETKKLEHLVLVLAGTNFEYDENGQGNNILHILVANGTEIGKYYKFSPFLTQCEEIVHGSIYGSSSKEHKQSADSTNDEIQVRETTYNNGRYLQNWEVLSDPGKECTLIDIESIGRVLPAVCRDVIDGNYTDTLAKLFMPSLLLIPAWSHSVTSFQSRLSVLAETIHTTSLLCNCCNAVDKNKSTIGKFVYPQKQDSEMISKTISLNRTTDCFTHCVDKEGCVYIIDLSFRDGTLDASAQTYFCNKTDP